MRSGRLLAREEWQWGPCAGRGWTRLRRPLPLLRSGSEGHPQGRRADRRPGERDARPTLEDGPQLGGWGAVLARYPDGSAAAAEGRFGRGRVILLGFHAEAPATWRRGMRFRTSADVDNDYAVRLIRAAAGGLPLAHY